MRAKRAWMARRTMIIRSSMVGAGCWTVLLCRLLTLLVEERVQDEETDEETDWRCRGCKEEKKGIELIKSKVC